MDSRGGRRRVLNLMRRAGGRQGVMLAAFRGIVGNWRLRESRASHRPAPALPCPAPRHSLSLSGGPACRWMRALGWFGRLDAGTRPCGSRVSDSGSGRTQDPCSCRARLVGPIRGTGVSLVVVDWWVSNFGAVRLAAGLACPLASGADLTVGSTSLLSTVLDNAHFTIPSRSCNHTP